ncbi:MAG: hypothetical protein II897_05805 [Clostridia bacterium]|nr:hypothetical protein [Clostridia bacterium]
MKATMRSSRTGTAVHNEHGHISVENRDVEIYDATHSSAETLKERELEVYADEFLAGIEERNQRYLAQRHPDKVRTLEQVYTYKQTRPEECLLQVGDMEKAIDRNLLKDLVTEFCRKLQKWNRMHGYPFRLLDVSYHFDEATPHAHVRRVWKYVDKRGYTRIGQEKALQMAGVELPYPDEHKGRYNNRKISFDNMAREMWHEVCREHGLDIDTKPLPHRRHLSTREYTAEQIRAKEARMEELTGALEPLENAVTHKQALAAEAESRAVTAREEASAAKEEACEANRQMTEAKEEAARYRREARLAYDALGDIKAETENARSILTQLNTQLDRERKSDLAGIMKGVAAMHDLDAIRKDHPELFDEKGRYKKKAGRCEREDRYKDILRN